jgi:alpha-N-arabinofuranosidase
MFLQTIYHPLKLYAEHTLPVALEPFVEAPTRAVPPLSGSPSDERPWDVSDLGPQPLLDVSATFDPDSGETCLAVVNRSRSDALATSITPVTGRVGCYVVNGPDVASVNSFEDPNCVNVRESSLQASGDTFEYTFEPHSVTILRYGSHR